MKPFEFRSPAPRPRPQALRRVLTLPLYLIWAWLLALPFVPAYPVAVAKAWAEGERHPFRAVADGMREGVMQLFRSWWNG